MDEVPDPVLSCELELLPVDDQLVDVVQLLSTWLLTDVAILDTLFDEILHLSVTELQIFLPHITLCKFGFLPVCSSNFLVLFDVWSE